MQMRVLLRATNTSLPGLVEVDEPGFSGSDEVNDLHVLAKELVGGKVRVGGSGDHVVGEGEVAGDVLGRPVREEGVQQTLITAVK